MTLPYWFFSLILMPFSRCQNHQFSLRLCLFSPLLAFINILFLFDANAQAPMQMQESVEALVIDDLVFSEENRTRKEWISEYLSLKFPMIVPSEELENRLAAYKSKLLTTGVFQDAKVEFVENRYLQIDLVEKWTTIPVVRGEFGGGTPLRIFGVYDTHSFGKLWTIGAEARQYGFENPGYVVWARNPRYVDGRYLVGVELWKDKRKRTFVDKDFEPIGEMSTESDRLRLQYLHPLNSQLKWTWTDGLRFGGDLQVRNVKPSKARALGNSPEGWAPENISIKENAEQEIWFQPTILYDDVSIRGVNYDGLRLFLKPGLVSGEKSNAPLHEAEMFFYLDLDRINLAIHSFYGMTTIDSIAGQKFLGGFDSIRGIPDGAIYGNIANFWNFELRKVFLKTKYLWSQAILFHDIGAATDNLSSLGKNLASSLGVGFRFSVPQVYRLMLRLDYAWSIDRPGTSGFSIGLNHFFQPYRPL